MVYELKLEKFQGPLEKLLELIEERKMEIGEISLAAVTDDFLKYLKSLEEAAKDSSDYLRLIVDFVSVASRLIFLKSKYLIPSAVTMEEEEEIKELEERLRIYRQFKPAAKIISDLWKSGEKEFGRQYFSVLGVAENLNLFYPGANLNLEAVAGSLSRIFADWEKMTLENAALKKEVISVEDKMKEVVRKMEAAGALAFRNLAESGNRAEIIAFFLAILHLAREQLILLEQNESFSDIMVVKKIESKNKIYE